MAYRSILKCGIDEFEIKKSRFIGYSCPVETEEEAIDFIEKIKTLYSDATHNCHAYILGENMMVQRFNDDGEPSGTAGIPMLEVLKQEGLTNIVVVVTRYFGGVLLGAGGLIRSYSKACKIGVDAGTIVDMKSYQSLSLVYDYVFHGKILNFLGMNNYYFLEAGYTDKVELNCIISLEEVNNFREDLVNLTSGEIVIDLIEDLIMPEKDGVLIIDEE